eukprot:TRINITY_DN33895_c0_g1_i1.p2 TRINITY_DN33895_c0_g1~~TRINITY_DN33895_c0_g1_i1.p2  ORF type:complete len:309 (+),score=60.41 TRINITY_DN33895_c0_g1_i1:50-928(+)
MAFFRHVRDRLAERRGGRRLTGDGAAPRVVVVGAGAGIGRGVAIAMAARGARLVIAARTRSDLVRVQEDCMAAGAGSCAVSVTDVTGDCSGLRETSSAELAGGIDLLVVCAGIGCHQTNGAAWRHDEGTAEAFRQTMAVNFFGCMNAMRALLPLVQGRRGHIVVLSSASALVGLPSRAAYCASKAALHAAVEALVADRKWDVTITEVFVVSVSGTKLRERGIRHGTTDGPASAGSSDIPVEVVVKRVLEAADRRQRRLYLPGRLRLLPAVKHLFPAKADGILERLVWQKARL